MINKLIDSLPFEAHVPGYRYCGPGTRLDEKLKNRVPGINKLDEACREHDIRYSQSNGNIGKRHEADRILRDKAWERATASDSGFGERAVALGVAGAMKTKLALGAGLNHISSELKRVRPKTLRQAASAALKVARRCFSPKTHKKTLSKRVLSIPKEGGVLNKVIPALASLSAAGHLPGGIKTVVDAASNIVNLRARVGNRNVKVGEGLSLKPFRKGYGLYLSPWVEDNIRR